MNPLSLLQKYYKKDSEAYSILVKHGNSVEKKAIEIIEKNKIIVSDISFIRESALLHDIGIFLTSSPKIYCKGKEPYIRHGILGREILEKEGYDNHAKLCENHLLISKKEIIKNRLPLPEREMIPTTTEEEIITLADKFFSKSSENIFYEKNIKEVREEMKRYGEVKCNNFDYLLKKYKMT